MKKAIKNRSGISEIKASGAQRVITALLISLSLCFSLAQAADRQDASSKEARNAEMDMAIFIASGTQERVLKIGIVDCMLYALKKNHDILINKINPKLKEDDVKIAQAEFEPEFTLDYSVEDNTEATTNIFQGAGNVNSNERDLSAGVAGKLYAGTEYSFDVATQRFKNNSPIQTLNPSYSVIPTLTITQPLLRGFGTQINKADIFIARNNKLESISSFKDTVIKAISDVKRAYYNYILFLESYSIEKLAFERVTDLLEINKARYSKGLVSSVDLLESEAAVAQRERVLLAFEAELKKAEDELKYITNIVDDPEVWNAKIELLDKPLFKPEKVDFANAAKNAFTFRPDYEAAKIDLKNRDIRITVAENALLPTIDLTGSFGLNGLGEDYKSALGKANSNYPDLSAGVQITIPWGGGERAEYDQRKLEKAQALLALRKLEQGIILEVRDRVREVNIQAKQVGVARFLRAKEQENYAAQKERYSAGQVSTHDMLDYQDKLSQAELGYVRSLIEYNYAIINLDRTQGLTLVKNDIKLEDN